jgi:hypothetical protein
VTTWLGEGDLVLNTFLKAGTNPDIARLASANIMSSKSTLVCFSGKLASGKDTMARLVFEALDIAEDDQVSFGLATALRREVDEILSILRQGQSLGKSSEAVAERMGVPLKDAEMVTVILWEARESDASSYTRRDDIRRMLQFWGTDVRRARYPTYWVDACLDSVASVASEGHSVAITDVRFPNEERELRRAGFFSVRLDVSDDVQAARLGARDGLVLAGAGDHSSETALDDWNEFSFRVGNDGDPSITCASIVQAMGR